MDQWSGCSRSVTYVNAVLGELPEGNGDDEAPRSVQRDDGSWLLDGRFPLDEFRELFDLAELPSGDFQTLAGLVITQLGHIPRVSESFELLGLRFEVVKMDSQRVNRVLVSPLAQINPTSIPKAAWPEPLSRHESRFAVQT